MPYPPAMGAFAVYTISHFYKTLDFALNKVLILCISWYEGRSINKLQNGAIPLILKIGKIWNIRFVGNLIFEHTKKISFDDDITIVTSSVHRTQSICVLFSPPVFCHNSQFITLCISLSLSCCMGSMPVGVHDIFHEMGPFILYTAEEWEEKNE